ncbi:MAG: beta-ketoacyl synthase N-terminal-like domain-containing protein [Roseovarius sp.]
MTGLSIVGIGSTTFARHEGRTAVSLAAEAGIQALRESGLDAEHIGALYLGNFISGFLTGQEVLAGLTADRMSLGAIPATKVEGACASGGIAFRHACMAVASGQCEAAIAIGVEKMSHAGTATVTQGLNCALDHEADAASGLTYPGLFALVWQAHAARYGTTREEVSAVVKKNRRNGLANPLASMGANLSDSDIEGAPVIADPLTLYDCCPISDGAAAVIVTRDDLARQSSATAIRVRASAQTSGRPGLAAHPDLCGFAATSAAAHRAFADARLAPADIDLIELHDCFSIAEIVDIEDLGFMPKGHGGAWAREGRTAVGGDLPVNPSGGLEAKGHPVGATGIGQIYEVVCQLRGDHANQVEGARLGLTHNLGGTGVACTVNILERTS